MKSSSYGLIFLFCCFLGLTFFSCQGQSITVGPNVYINLNESTIHQRVQLPPSFSRESYDENSFAWFLQNFPLKPHRSKVYYYNGEPKHTQNFHLAVLDIDTGKRDLQQCADAVIRLRAEYLYHLERFDEIAFHFTNGFLAEYSRWRSGERIKVDGSNVSWYITTNESKSYQSFREYLNMVFSYAGTLSLNKELKSISLDELQIGDIFIQGGSPGHAIIVIDLALHHETGEKIFLMAQSYMPAQDIHVIKKNKNFIYGPWYSVKEVQEKLSTPEWTFYPKDLKRFQISKR